MRSKDYPVTYEVVNTAKRPRWRAGVLIPGAKPGVKYEPVKVTVPGRAAELRLTTCKYLKCTKVGNGRRKSTGAGGKTPEQTEAGKAAEQTGTAA